MGEAVKSAHLIASTPLLRTGGQHKRSMSAGVAEWYTLRS